MGRDRGWSAAQDRLVPVEGSRLSEKIREKGWSRRGVATKVKKAAKRSVTPQTLDLICSGRQRRCRAWLRATLAVVLDVGEWWLAGHPLLPPDRPPAEIRAWFRLVLKLKLQEPAHSALLNLPAAIGQASLLFDVLPRDRPTGIGAPSWAIQAARLEQRAWLRWLRGWVRARGIGAVRAALEKEPLAISGRFVDVPRFTKL